jgi:uncharacterized membrane protein
MIMIVATATAGLLGSVEGARHGGLDGTGLLLGILLILTIILIILIIISSSSSDDDNNNVSVCVSGRSAWRGG